MTRGTLILKQPWIWEFASLGILLAVYLWMTVPLIPKARDSIALLSVVSWDSASAARIVKDMWESQTLSTGGFYSYGAVQLYLGLGGTLILRIFGPIMDGDVILSLRIVSLLFGTLTLVAAYILARRLFNPVVALAAAALLALTPDFQYWSTMIHPDTVQLFFVVVALIFTVKLAERYTLWALILASTFAGLAFSTKYVGIFLLPVIVGALVISLWRSSRLSLKRMAQQVGLIVVIVLAVFMITNPDAVVHPRGLVGAILAESRRLRFGHVYAEEGGLLRWIAQLFGNSLLGPGGIVVIASGALALGVYLALRRKIPESLMGYGRLTLLAWVVFFLGYLAISVNTIRPQYALPITPAIYVLGVATIIQPIWELTAAAKRQNQLLARSCGAAILLVAILFTFNQGLDQRSQQLERYARLSDDPLVAAGNWLSQHYAVDTRILYDAYVYIPPGFHDAEVSWGQTEEKVQVFQPDVIVTNEAIRDRYLDASLAPVSRVGTQDYLEAYHFYERLEGGGYDNFEPVASFGNGQVKIFERTTPP